MLLLCDGISNCDASAKSAGLLVLYTAAMQFYVTDFICFLVTILHLIPLFLAQHS
jgi:hypothetical protein